MGEFELRVPDSIQAIREQMEDTVALHREQNARLGADLAETQAKISDLTDQLQSKKTTEVEIEKQINQNKKDIDNVKTRNIVGRLRTLGDEPEERSQDEAYQLYVAWRGEEPNDEGEYPTLERLRRISAELTHSPDVPKFLVTYDESGYLEQIAVPDTNIFVGVNPGNWPDYSLAIRVGFKSEKLVSYKLQANTPVVVTPNSAYDYLLSYCLSFVGELPRTQVIEDLETIPELSASRVEELIANLDTSGSPTQIFHIINARHELGLPNNPAHLQIILDKLKDIEPRVGLVFAGLALQKALQNKDTANLSAAPDEL